MKKNRKTKTMFCNSITTTPYSHDNAPPDKK